MIKSFQDKDTEKLFNRERVRRFESFANRAREDLIMLAAVKRLEDLGVIAGFQLEKLKGSRKEEYSIRINKQFRICFVWKNGDAYEVTIEDYH
jgi:proteic killer suppression protein